MSFKTLLKLSGRLQLLHAHIEAKAQRAAETESALAGPLAVLHDTAADEDGDDADEGDADDFDDLDGDDEDGVGQKRHADEEDEEGDEDEDEDDEDEDEDEDDQ